MNAVVLQEPRMILFGPENIPGPLRGELVDATGGTIREAVALDVPEDVAEWPRGSERPEPVLCVARDDPGRFRVFKYRREVDQDRFVPAGMAYAVVSSWEGFLEAYRPLDRIGRITDESDRPGLDEEVMRALIGGASPA